MNAKNILKVKRPLEPQTPPPLNDSALEEAVVALQQIETETQQQPPLVDKEVFLGTPRDESVYGCGWSLTELLNEFNEK